LTALAMPGWGALGLAGAVFRHPGLFLVLTDGSIGKIVQFEARIRPNIQPRGAQAVSRVDEHRRRRLLEATWRLIAERGYHVVRVADIARMCGTSTGTVHYYFPGKQDVLVEALKYCVEQAFERQSAELKGIEDARERLLRLVEMQLPQAKDVCDEWSIRLQFWAEAAIRPELRDVHNQFYSRWLDTVVRIVRRGQRQGVFREVDAHQAALRLTALTDGAAIKVLTGAPGMTVDLMRQMLVEFIDQNLARGADDGDSPASLVDSSR
jgi:AcrR family transcriptional regulator